MNSTLSVLNNVKYILIGVVILLGIALIVFLITLIKANKARKKEVNAFIKQLHKEVRSDVLDRAIAGTKITSANMLNYWLVKIVEQNQFGDTEHFFNLSQGDITIGREFSTNKYCIYDELFDDNQCKIVLLKEQPALVNLSNTVPSVFVPGKQYQRNIKKDYKMRDGEMIKLYSQDMLVVGGTKLLFSVYNSASGLM